MKYHKGNLNDRNKGGELQRQAEEGLRTIDKTELPGKFKYWCVQYALYPRLMWPLQESLRLTSN